ncbi:hypothetical protein T06_5328, partial [Trichinella sp. T6]
LSFTKSDICENSYLATQEDIRLPCKSTTTIFIVKNRSRVLYARDTQVQFAKRSIDRQTRVDCMM